MPRLASSEPTDPIGIISNTSAAPKTVKANRHNT